MSQLLMEINTHIESSIEVKRAILKDTELLSRLENLSLLVLKCLLSGGKIIFSSNGGSFADAQHLSAEFVSRFQFDRVPLASIALELMALLLTLLQTIMGLTRYFHASLRRLLSRVIFIFQLRQVVTVKNIIESLKVSKALGLFTICFTGKSGGLAKNLCECICVPSSVTVRIQESHILRGHILCCFVGNMFLKASQGAQKKGIE